MEKYLQLVQQAQLAKYLSALNIIKSGGEIMNTTLTKPKRQTNENFFFLLFLLPTEFSKVKK
jgi:hypothetical protein